MSHFAIIYASHEGQTQKVAHHVARQLENLGHTARLVNVGDEDPDALLGSFDAVVVAGDLDSAERASALGEFVKGHKDALRAAPSALLSVTLSAGAPDRESQAAAQADLETFEDYCGWRPNRAIKVGGAVHDRYYGLPRRLFLHVWMNLKGIRPDPSGHTELTDWPALEAFVKDFAAATAGRQGGKKAGRGRSAKPAAPRRGKSRAAK